MALPLDILIHILSQLPVSRSLCDDSIRTFVAFLEASSLLREAAMVSTLWQPHYIAHYQHCDELEELSRHSRFNNDWRLLYGARRRLDMQALVYLDMIIRHREGQLDNITAVFNMGFDVWDVLQMESEQPVPTILKPYFTPESVSCTKVAPHAITRRFWARSLVDSIARNYAIDLWDKCHRGNASITFVEAFSAISCFDGHSPLVMSSLLDNLTGRCREHLIEQKCTLDPEEHGYDIHNICTQICNFMHAEGFGPVDSHIFHNMSNIFPHKYLTTNKKSIPISLVHAFVAIARGVGIMASPVDFPQRVLAHVRSPDPDVDDFYVDVFGSHKKAILSLRDDIVELVMLNGIPPHSMSSSISPVSATPMLLRTSRNILASLNAELALSESRSRLPIYLAFTMYLLLTGREQFVERTTTYMGFVDSVTVLPYALLPMFPEGNPAREKLEERWDAVVELHEKTAAVSSRYAPENLKVKYHVGMLFQHREYKYIGCISAWDNICKQDEKWISDMGVERLPRGKNQPFYTSFALDGSERYVAEDNVIPVDATLTMILNFFPVIENFAVYFSDVETHKTSELARLVPSPEVQCAFPDDDAIGRKILEESN